MAIKWLNSGYILNRDDNILTNSKLNWKMKSAIIKRIYSRPEISLLTKSNLLSTIIGNDKSDLSSNLILACEASLPDLESKSKVWEKIVDPDNGLSAYQREAYMSSFFQRDEFCHM
jgi:hypothetical protein